MDDDPKTPADLYAEQLGADALERQARLARERYVCCGMVRTDGHHEHCPARPKDEPTVPTVIPGQGSLL